MSVTSNVSCLRLLIFSRQLRLKNNFRNIKYCTEKLDIIPGVEEKLNEYVSIFNFKNMKCQFVYFGFFAFDRKSFNVRNINFH